MQRPTSLGFRVDYRQHPGLSLLCCRGGCIFSLSPGFGQPKLGWFDVRPAVTGISEKASTIQGAHHNFRGLLCFSGTGSRLLLKPTELAKTKALGSLLAPIDIIKCHRPGTLPDPLSHQCADLPAFPARPQLASSSHSTSSLYIHGGRGQMAQGRLFSKTVFTFQSMGAGGTECPVAG